MGMRLKNGNWSDALADTPENQKAYGASSNSTATSVGYNAPQYGVGSSSGGGSSGSNPSAAVTSAPGAGTGSTDAQMLGAVSGNGNFGVGGNASGGGLQALLNALAAGNVAAANEAIRQFNVDSGLNAQKFQQSVLQYNQDHGLAVTKQAADIAAQAAGISGMFNGQPTEAARQFNVSAQQAALDEQDKTGVAALQLRATMQGDPFRQLDNEYATQANSGLSRAVAGLTGQYGLSNPFANPGGGGASFVAPGSAQLAARQTGLTNPNQVIARQFNTAPQNVQDMTTSALSMNGGMTQAAANKQIQNSLPRFNAPSFGLATV